MEIKSDVCLGLLDLADVVGDEHVLIAVDPNGVGVDILADLVDTLCNLAVDRFELGPIVEPLLQVIARVDEIVHVWSDEGLVESQIWRDLFLCEEDGVAEFLTE